jgi:hypothetical protein
MDVHDNDLGSEGAHFDGPHSTVGDLLPIPLLGQHFLGVDLDRAPNRESPTKRQLLFQFRPANQANLFQLLLAEWLDLWHVGLHGPSAAF